MAENDTEAQQQQAELNQLEYTISDEALNSVGAGPEQQQEESEDTAELLTMVAAYGRDLFMPNWDISDPEVQAFGDAGGRLLDKYLPDGLGIEKYKEEIAFFGVVVGIYFKNKGKPLQVEPGQPEGGDSATETE